MSERNDDLDPNLPQARQTSLLAHAVVIRLKELGLPEEYDDDLGSMSVDLADMQGGLETLSDGVRRLVESAGDWRAAADSLVDLIAAVDHLRSHVESAGGPLDRLAEYAYGRADEPESDSSA